MLERAAGVKVHIADAGTPGRGMAVLMFEGPGTSMAGDWGAGVQAEGSLAPGIASASGTQTGFSTLR